MDRRAFLKALTTGLAATAATAVIDPEELLWVPGAKTYFLPPDPPAVTPVGGLVGGVLRPGDVFTIDGVFATNPYTHQKTRLEQQFVVTGVSTSGVIHAWPNNMLLTVDMT